MHAPSGEARQLVETRRLSLDREGFAEAVMQGIGDGFAGCDAEMPCDPVI